MVRRSSASWRRRQRWLRWLIVHDLQVAAALSALLMALALWFSA